MPPTLLTLAIENSNPGSSADASHRPGVALGYLTPGQPELTHVLHAENFRELPRDQDDLISAIDRSFQAAGITKDRLQAVAVSIGPGGFTSTRMACAAGAMIAEALNIPAIPVPSALVAWQAHGSFSTRVAVALAGKGPSAWVRLFNGSDHTHHGEVFLADQLLAHAPDVVLADAHLPVPIRDALVNGSIPIAPLRFSPADALAAAAYGPLGKADDLLPLYPREPEAVTLWRARHRA